VCVLHFLSLSHDDTDHGLIIQLFDYLTSQNRPILLIIIRRTMARLGMHNRWMDGGTTYMHGLLDITQIHKSRHLPVYVFGVPWG